jgi:hypothetical protein
MTDGNPVARRFIAELYDWLTPELLYHCLTGEEDEAELLRISKLDPWLLEPLLNKAMREWPQRLSQLDGQRRREKAESKALVQQFVLNLTNEQNH